MEQHKIDRISELSRLSRERALTAEEAAEREAFLRQLPFLANVTAMPPDQSHPLLNGRATWYVCRGHVCLPPSNTWEP